MSLYGGIELPGRPDAENVRKLDLLPIPSIRRMERLGFAIDIPYLNKLSSRFSSTMKELEKDISSYIPYWALDQFVGRSSQIEDEEGDASINASSAEQIADLLFNVLKVGSGKKLKTTKGGSRISTGKRQLETLREDHPIVAKILSYREYAKLVSTYVVSLPQLAKFHPRGECCPVCELKHVDDTWRLHTELPTTRAATGRIASRNPNLQNIPVRTEEGALVRAAFIASPGTKIVSIDLSQIELRALAHLSRCKSMIEVYENGGDIHDDTCHKALGVPLDVKPDKYKHRMAAKRVNFGIQNGTTEKGLYLQLVMDFGSNHVEVPKWLTEDWCKWFIEEWLNTRPEVREYFDLTHYRARRYKKSWDPFGRMRRIPEVESTHSWIRQAGLRQAQNLPVTSAAAGQLKLIMGEAEELLLEFERQGIWAWPLLTIHDQLMVEVDGRYAEGVAEALTPVFDRVMIDKDTGEDLWRTRIESDCEVGERWGVKE